MIRKSLAYSIMLMDGQKQHKSCLLFLLVCGNIEWQREARPSELAAGDRMVYHPEESRAGPD